MWTYSAVWGGAVGLQRECYCCGPREIVVANEILDSTDVRHQFFGEREGRAHQTRHALPQGNVAAFNVMGFAGFLRDGFMLLHRNHPCGGVVVIRMERGLCRVDQWDLGLQRCGTVATAIPDMKRNALAGDRVHGDPDPLLVGLLACWLAPPQNFTSRRLELPDGASPRRLDDGEAVHGSHRDKS